MKSKNTLNIFTLTFSDPDSATSLAEDRRPDQASGGERIQGQVQKVSCACSKTSGTSIF